MGSLFIGIPDKESCGWSICFWVSASPAAVLALSMEFCAESRHWLYKVVVMGRQVIAASSFVSAPVAPNLSVGAMLLCGIFHSILTAKQMKSEFVLSFALGAWSSSWSSNVRKFFQPN